MQPDLQFRNDRAAQRHHSHTRLPHALGLRRCARASLSQRLPHAASRSGCFPTLPGSRCSRRCWWAARWCCARRLSAREALALIEAERITHGAFVPVQLERLLACPERGAVRNGQPRDIDVLRFAAQGRREARFCTRVRLRADRAVRAHRGTDHHSRARGTRAQSSLGRQTRAWRRYSHPRRG